VRVGFASIPSVLLVFLSAIAVGGAACYQQPPIPRDKPLRCSSQQEGECPVGFRCIALGLCANINCASDDDCPRGLVCTERTGCDLAGDAGTDGGDGGDGGLLPGGGGDAIGGGGGGGGGVDAPAPIDFALPDAPTTFDLGGNS
jgi:hypothetical protein